MKPEVDVMCGWCSDGLCKGDGSDCVFRTMLPSLRWLRCSCPCQEEKSDA